MTNPSLNPNVIKVTESNEINKIPEMVQSKKYFLRKRSLHVAFFFFTLKSL